MSTKLETKSAVYLKVLGERLRKLRIKKGYTSIKGLNIEGINALSYGYIERGQRDVRYTDLVNICREFDISIQDLFYNIDDEILLVMKTMEITDQLISKKHG